MGVNGDNRNDGEMGRLVRGGHQRFDGEREEGEVEVWEESVNEQHDRDVECSLCHRTTPLFSDISEVLGSRVCNIHTSG